MAKMRKRNCQLFQGCIAIKTLVQCCREHNSIYNRIKMNKILSNKFSKIIRSNSILTLNNKMLIPVVLV